MLANDRDAEAAPLAPGVKVTVKLADCPAVSVVGNEIPESTNSPLLELADEIVTDAPLAVTLPVSAAFEPTVTLLKLRLVGETANVPEAVPVPESAIPSWFAAFDDTDRLPLAVPALVGVNVTLKVTLWPDVRLMGKLLNPLVENDAPVKFTCEIEIVDPPVLVSVSDKLVLLPTWVPLNARVVGFAASAPGVAPVPDSGMLKFGFAPVEVIFTLPLAAPLAVGEKSTVNDVLWRAPNVSEGASPLTLNAAPLAVAVEIVRLVPPELVRVAFNDCEVPVWTFPKLMLAGFEANWPSATPVPESGMESMALLALELMVSAPLVAPAAEGVNSTLKAAVCPAPSVIGAARPVTLNPAPLIVAPDSVTVSPPVLVTVIGTV